MQEAGTQLPRMRSVYGCQHETVRWKQIAEAVCDLSQSCQFHMVPWHKASTYLCQTPLEEPLGKNI